MKNFELLFALPPDNNSFMWLETILKEFSEELPLSYFEGDGFWMDGTNETLISVRSICWKPENEFNEANRLSKMRTLANRIRTEFDQTVTLQITEVTDYSVFHSEKS